MEVLSVKDPEGFDIRYSDAVRDVDILRSYLARPGECDPFPFSFEESHEATRNWLGFARYQASLTGTMEGEVCAIGTLFLMPYIKVAHHASFFLYVVPEHRKKGVGSSMVKNLCHLAKTRFRLERLHVELFGDNPLTHILRRRNFQHLFSQEDFYEKEGVFSRREVWECLL